VIPVALAPEPATFNAKVRQKGADAMLELVGKAPSKPRPGRKRKVVASRRDRIPSDDLPPYWRDVLPEMRKAYNGRCAYLAMYLEPATGSSSVDHVVPRSQSWRLVYEWSNYRLAASLINSKKSDLALVLDPCAIKPNLFALDFVSMEVIAGPAATGAAHKQVDETIATLGLNAQDCVDQRSEYYLDYKARDISLRWLERRAPFVAQEHRPGVGYADLLYCLGWNVTVRPPWYAHGDQEPMSERAGERQAAALADRAAASCQG
jgi:5-methylcytosine-specific restriction endonuclease McrA